VFSALQKKGITHYLLAMVVMSKDTIAYVPDHFWDEFAKHEDKIARATKLSKDEIREFVDLLREYATTVPKTEYSKYLETAKEVCRDKKDAPYVALALAVGGTLITGDKRLIEDARKIIPVLTPGEFLSLLKGQKIR